MTEGTPGTGAESVPRLPRGVRLRFDETRDQWLLLGPERVFKLDSIGYEILRRVDGETSLREIADDLARSFDAEAATIERDVRRYLAEMSARGMIDLR
jgi:coenzyme PQQ biosynthesis protein PqqD